MKNLFFVFLFCCAYYSGWTQTAVDMAEPKLAQDVQEALAKVTTGLTSGQSPKTMAKPSFLVKMNISVRADKAIVKRFEFGYQDEVTIHLNGERIYFHNKGFAKRRLSLEDKAGFFDYIFIPLKKGLNEIILEGYQTDGGIGIRCRWEDLDGILVEL